MTISIIENPSPVILCAKCTGMVKFDLSGRNWNDAVRDGKVKVLCYNQECEQHGRAGWYELPKPRELALVE